VVIAASKGSEMMEKRNGTYEVEVFAEEFCVEEEVGRCG